MTRLTISYEKQRHSKGNGDRCSRCNRLMVAGENVYQRTEQVSWFRGDDVVTRGICSGCKKKGE